MSCCCCCCYGTGIKSTAAFAVSLFLRIYVNHSVFYRLSLSHSLSPQINHVRSLFSGKNYTFFLSSPFIRHAMGVCLAKHPRNFRPSRARYEIYDGSSPCDYWRFEVYIHTQRERERRKVHWGFIPLEGLAGRGCAQLC